MTQLPPPFNPPAKPASPTTINVVVTDVRIPFKRYAQLALFLWLTFMAYRFVDGVLYRIAMEHEMRQMQRIIGR